MQQRYVVQNVFITRAFNRPTCICVYKLKPARAAFRWFAFWSFSFVHFTKYTGGHTDSTLSKSHDGPRKTRLLNFCSPISYIWPSLSLHVPGEAMVAAWTDLVFICSLTVHSKHCRVPDNNGVFPFCLHSFRFEMSSETSSGPLCLLTAKNTPTHGSVEEVVNTMCVFQHQQLPEINHLQNHIF